MKLSLDQRAALYTQLAALEKAGLPAAQAWGMVKLDARAGGTLEAMQQAVRSGQNIAVAGARLGILDRLEHRMLMAALAAGSPEPIYRRLAETYAARSRRYKQMLARLALPAFIILALGLVRQLPAFLQGGMDVLSFLLFGALPLAGLVLVLWLLRLGMRSLRDAGPGLRKPIESFLLRLPLIGPSLVRRDGQRFAEHLGLLLEAGIPMFNALPATIETLHYWPVRAEFAQVPPRLHAGQTLAQALDPVRRIGNPDLKAYVQTGEASGTLPRLLFHHAAIEASAIDSFDEQVASWVPRLVYAVLVVAMAWQLINDPGLHAPAL